MSNINRSKEGKKVGKGGEIRPTDEIDNFLDDVFGADKEEGVEVLGEGDERGVGRRGKKKKNAKKKEPLCHWKLFCPFCEIWCESKSWTPTKKVKTNQKKKKKKRKKKPCANSSSTKASS